MVQAHTELISELPLKRWTVEDYDRMVAAGNLTRKPQADAYQFEQVWAGDAQVAPLAFPDVMIDLQQLLL